MRSKFIFVLSSDGDPLMPTERYGRVRKLLKKGEAKIVKHNPFTIQLLKDHSSHFQDITFGEDTGYKHIGCSVVSENKEFLRIDYEQRGDIKELMNNKSQNRRIRRSRLRHRKPRFNNRKRDILRLKEGDKAVLKKDINEEFYKNRIVIFSHKEDNNAIICDENGQYLEIDKKSIQKLERWLPPSILHRKNAHLKLIEEATKFLPISCINIEIADFDIQKIKNPNIKGEEYQQGEQLGFNNVREYVLHRDDHKCQNPNCENNEKVKILQVHHIVFRDFGGSNSPENLITLCTNCHKSENHKSGGFLYKWMEEKKKVGAFKGETFMSIIKWMIVNELRVIHPNIDVNPTYGYITKTNRIALKKQYPEIDFEKSHSTDAFVIAGGNLQKRAEEQKIKPIRRNNRCLTSFRDAKYIDIRDGLEKSGSELNSGRTTRNKTLNTENLRKYRGKKTREGQNTKAKSIYKIKKGTLIKITKDWTNKGGKKVKAGSLIVKAGEIYVAGGHGSATTVYIGKNKKVPLKVCSIIYHKKGIFIQ